MSELSQPLFFIGQCVHHKKFDYRGVIVDVDAGFSGTEDWYQQVALSRPPKNKPWYHVLVHNSNRMTYVERGVSRYCQAAVIEREGREQRKKREDFLFCVLL